MISCGKFILRLLESFVELENDSLEMSDKWNLKTTYGVALDQIGQILNVSRQGLTDSNYRKKMIGQIAVNFSLGSIEDLIRVFKLISNATHVRILNNNDGTFNVELTGDEVYNLDQINNIPAGGTGIGHVYLVDDGTFVMDDFLLGLDSGELAENII
jgi:hypothetical protein